MKKGEIFKRINSPKGWLVAAAVIALGVLAACLVNMQGGRSESVEFRALSEAEIPQAVESGVIPEYRDLERALACMVDDKVYVIVTRGEKPTSGYEVEIDRILLEGEAGDEVLVVYADFKDPEPGTALAQVLTYPLEVAETSLTELPARIELRVQYE